MTTVSETIPEAGTAAGARDSAPQRAQRYRFLRYLGTKLLAAVISFAITLVGGFVLFSMLPSNARTLTAGHATSAAQLAALRHSLGLDEPVWQRFLTFVSNTLHGNLGQSVQFHQSVSSLIMERLWPTLLLMGASTVIAIVLGLWLGVRSGWRHGSREDRATSAVALMFWSMPTFWLGMILLLGSLAVFGGLLPAGGMVSTGSNLTGLSHILDVAWHMILPTTTLVLVGLAQYTAIMRSSIIDERGAPYLLTARAKGLSDDVVRRRHAVPNALLPSVTMIFLQLGGLISGAVTVETVFSWPGLGYLSFQALEAPDLPLLEGTFIVFSASVIIMNLLADVAYVFLDPRVRAQ